MKGKNQGSIHWQARIKVATNQMQGSMKQPITGQDKDILEAGDSVEVASPVDSVVSIASSLHARLKW